MLTETRTNYEEIVKVLVGPDKTPFNVHRATVCAKSKFFEAALTRDWKEKKEATVNLPDMAPYEFAVFVHWMYAGEIDDEGSGLKRPTDDKTFGGVFAAFLAGDVLDNETLRNQAMTEMIRIDNDERIIPGDISVSRYWDRTAEGSPLRRYLVDSYALYAPEDSLAGIVRLGPPDFTEQVLRKFAQIRGALRKEHAITLATACKYHDHKETPTCSQT